MKYNYRKYKCNKVVRSILSVTMYGIQFARARLFTLDIIPDRVAAVVHGPFFFIQTKSFSTTRITLQENEIIFGKPLTC